MMTQSLNCTLAELTPADMNIAKTRSMLPVGLLLVSSLAAASGANQENVHGRNAAGTKVRARLAAEVHGHLHATAYHYFEASSTGQTSAGVELQHVVNPPPKPQMPSAWWYNATTTRPLMPWAEDYILT
jgi:hypothetical protein